MDSIVEARQVCFTFGEAENARQVIRGVDLLLQAGEIVLLSGPSGSGKTTLLTLIGALRRMQQGSLKVLGRELNGANETMRLEVRREVGYIFQLHNLLPFLSVVENVMMGWGEKRTMSASEQRQKAITMLDAVGLADRADEHPAQLSGGQKQRVAIARALVHQPRLILADEPTSSLDRQTGHDAVLLLRQLAREQGSAILLVTHDSRIWEMADRVVGFEDGVIVSSR